MKKMFLVAALLAAAAVQSSRADLLIKKDGKSSWIAGHETKADSLIYRATEDGPVQTISLSEVDLILPQVQLDRQYTPSQADRALESVKRAGIKYPYLIKQIEMLKHQWQQVKEPDTEADGKINRLVQQFMETDKSPKSFQDIAAQMDMIGLRDAVGTVTAKIRKKLEVMQRMVFDAAKVKIEAMAAADTKSVENYVNLRNLVSEVKMVRATDEQKKYMGEIQDKCRKATIESGLKASQMAFFGTKTIDGYLASMAILGDLKGQEVPALVSEKAEVDRYLKVMRNAARMSCTAYDFEHNGYPMDAQDKRLLAGEYFISSGLPADMRSVEHCCLVATGVPLNARNGEVVNFPVRLIFNRKPLPGVQYSLIADVSAPGNSKREFIAVPMKGLRAGHLDTAVTLTIPHPNAYAGSGQPAWGVSLCLAYRGGTGNTAEWTGASGVCRIAPGVR